MNVKKYKEILNEIDETVEILKNNIENESVLKFFTGKLHLLTKQIIEIFLSN